MILKRVVLPIPFLFGGLMRNFKSNKVVSIMFRIIIFTGAVIAIVCAVKTLDWVFAFKDGAENIPDSELAAHVGEMKTTFQLFRMLCFVTAGAVVTSIFGRFGVLNASVFFRTAVLIALLVGHIVSMPITQGGIRITEVYSKADSTEIRDLDKNALTELGMTQAEVDQLDEDMGDDEKMIVFILTAFFDVCVYAVLAFTSIYYLVMLSSYTQLAKEEELKQDTQGPAPGTLGYSYNGYGSYAANVNANNYQENSNDNIFDE